jgi:hypothetical protein
VDAALVQLACLALWSAAWPGRQATLVDWLLVGVLALALWTSGSDGLADA